MVFRMENRAILLTKDSRNVVHELMQCDFTATYDSCAKQRREKLYITPFHSYPSASDSVQWHWQGKTRRSVIQFAYIRRRTCLHSRSKTTSDSPTHLNPGKRNPGNCTSKTKLDKKQRAFIYVFPFQFQRNGESEVGDKVVFV